MERHTESAFSWPEPQAMTLTKLVQGLHWSSWSDAPLAASIIYLQLAARRGDAGPEPSHPRRSISSPSHKPQRKWASGREICCPSTQAISRRWHSETYPRTWASFLKQCHSPLALRQYSLSVSPSSVSSIEIRIQALAKCSIRAAAGRVARHRECVSRTGTYWTRPLRTRPNHRTRLTLNRIDFEEDALPGPS
jgi:hypothetical protein